MRIHLHQQSFRVMAICPNLTVSVPKIYPHWTAMQMCHFTHTKWDSIVFHHLAGRQLFTIGTCFNTYIYGLCAKASNKTVIADIEISCFMLFRFHKIFLHDFQCLIEWRQCMLKLDDVSYEELLPCACFFGLKFQNLSKFMPFVQTSFTAQDNIFALI